MSFASHGTRVLPNYILRIVRVLAKFRDFVIQHKGAPASVKRLVDERGDILSDEANQFAPAYIEKVKKTVHPLMHAACSGDALGDKDFRDLHIVAVGAVVGYCLFELENRYGPFGSLSETPASETGQEIRMLVLKLEDLHFEYRADAPVIDCSVLESLKGEIVSALRLLGEDV